MDALKYPTPVYSHFTLRKRGKRKSKVQTQMRHEFVAYCEWLKSFACANTSQGARTKQERRTHWQPKTVVKHIFIDISYLASYPSVRPSVRLVISPAIHSVAGSTIAPPYHLNQPSAEPPSRVLLTEQGKKPTTYSKKRHTFTSAACATTLRKRSFRTRAKTR